MKVLFLKKIKVIFVLIIFLVIENLPVEERQKLKHFVSISDIRKFLKLINNRD